MDFWASREPREVVHSHLNYIVPDTLRWEQSAAYYLVPDFIVRLKGDPPLHLILQTKGFDPLAEIKKAAAERWVAAVNADGKYGQWRYAMARATTEVLKILAEVSSGATVKAGI